MAQDLGRSSFNINIELFSTRHLHLICNQLFLPIRFLKCWVYSLLNNFQLLYISTIIPGSVWICYKWAVLFVAPHLIQLFSSWQFLFICNQCINQQYSFQKNWVYFASSTISNFLIFLTPVPGFVWIYQKWAVLFVAPHSKLIQKNLALGNSFICNQYNFCYSFQNTGYIPFSIIFYCCKFHSPYKDLFKFAKNEQYFRLHLFQY